MYFPHDSAHKFCDLFIKLLLQYFPQVFLVALGRVRVSRKHTYYFVMCVRLSVCPTARPFAYINSAPTGRTYMKFDIENCYGKLSIKYKFV